jgi:hypothetical protein
MGVRTKKAVKRNEWEAKTDKIMETLEKDFKNCKVICLIIGKEVTTSIRLGFDGNSIDILGYLEVEKFRILEKYRGLLNGK